LSNNSVQAGFIIVVCLLQNQLDGFVKREYLPLFPLFRCGDIALRQGVSPSRSELELANYRDWGHCWYKVRQHPSFDPVYEGEAMFAAVSYNFKVGR